MSIVCHYWRIMSWPLLADNDVLYNGGHHGKCVVVVLLPNQCKVVVGRIRLRIMITVLLVP